MFFTCQSAHNFLQFYYRNINFARYFDIIKLLYIIKSLMEKIIIIYFAKIWKGMEKTHTHGTMRT